MHKVWEHLDSYVIMVLLREFIIIMYLLSGVIVQFVYVKPYLSIVM